ncbi:MAG: hypothetical protein ABIB79_02385 [archaeon]
MGGKLKLGILGLYTNGNKITCEELKDLSRKALSFYPLKNIFEVSCVDSRDLRLCHPGRGVEQREAIKFKAINELDSIVAIQKDGLCKYDGILKIIYSEEDPIVLAHEIGHSLGLKHPVLRCGQRICDKIYRSRCEYSKDLMGCANLTKETFGFSKKDIIQLEAKLKC